ncbi:oligopeptide/dipeptide ABC transporter ATP-binding protein [Lysinibacillus sp. NPDC094403]|uniref:oligopeptide/dipeptide ABC transporter ATP-binding protein n=1 Tax=Lysinibacillus sp. NPDC094403 TaxID=3390581 RepID=UPI003CFCA351
MYLGKIVEEGPTDSLFSTPLHPYTQALLSAVPTPNPQIKKNRIILKGDIPSPLNLPVGCVFHTRCPYMKDKYKSVTPLKKEVSKRHFVACHLH